MSKDKEIQKIPKYSTNDLTAKSDLANRGLNELRALRLQRLKDLFIKALQEAKDKQPQP